MTIKKFLGKLSGVANRKGEVRVITSLFATIFLFAILMPVAFEQIFTTNTTGWTTIVTSLWQYVPLLAIVAVLMALIYKAVGRG